MFLRWCPATSSFSEALRSLLEIHKSIVVFRQFDKIQSIIQRSKMFALSRTVAPRIASATAQQTRNYNIVAKPRVRVSFAEKVIHGIFLGSIPLICPLYLSCKFGQWTQEQMDAE
ncbi:hypothetical protein TSAR_001747 [Trichomalopsis sarcophagae]|uniref:Uncharacterized protein n=1 Tax=Trichomalopsis sarcophagae TaxID=543379 RepID=A0A232EZB8_9HYME|nr:hypothetical protein TSAR_001747 [Trichomalopsis sarcophagae]